MNRIISPVTLLALILAAPAYAQAPANTQNIRADIKQDAYAINGDRQTLSKDEQEIHELDRRRNEALRTKHPEEASKLQTLIDQKRNALKDTKADMAKKESDIDRQKREADEQCSKNPACAEKKKNEELTAQLENLHRALASDEAAAARIAHDKEEIAKIETALGQHP